MDQFGDWEQLSSQLMLLFIQSGTIVVDVGSHVGSHPLAFARAVGSTGLVLAVEPQAHLFGALCGSVQLNNLQNVVALHAVAGRQSDAVRVPLIKSGIRNANFGAMSFSNDATTSVAGSSAGSTASN